MEPIASSLDRSLVRMTTMHVPSETSLEISICKLSPGSLPSCQPVPP